MTSEMTLVLKGQNRSTGENRIVRWGLVWRGHQKELTPDWWLLKHERGEPDKTKLRVNVYEKCSNLLVIKRLHIRRAIKYFLLDRKKIKKIFVNIQY